MRVNLDDPRLTAYVLDELPDEERKEVEALLASSSEARQQVEQIKAAAGMVSEAMSQEPLVGLTEEQIQHLQARTGGNNWWPRAAVFGALAASLLLALFLVQPRKPGIGFLAEHREQPLPLEGRAGGELILVVPSTELADAVEGGVVSQPSEDRKTETGSTVMAGRLDRQPPLNNRSVSDLISVAPGKQGADEGRSNLAQSRTLEASPPPKEQPKNENFLAEPGQAVVPTTEEKTIVSLEQDSRYRQPSVTQQAVGEREVGIMRLTPGRAEVAAAPADSLRVVPFSDRPDIIVPPAPEFNTEAYQHLRDNPFLAVVQNPLSTFSIDVDTASYSNVRRFLTGGQLPPADAVRIEELINYFRFDYPTPSGEHPFAVHIEQAAAPWKPEHRLVRIGLRGKDVDLSQRPAANLVFLLDVSGSMRPANKLPLLKKAMGLLVEQMTPRDRVAIVVYAGASGLALPSTPGNQQQRILDSLNHLQAGGSTNGASGIQLAYQTAASNFIEGGINRVILATDGDFNVGVTSHGELTRLIEEKAAGGVFLTVLGFGMGNYKDSTLEMLADRGNGNYGYVDNFREARKLLVEQLAGTLITIAKDVKIQVEFNPRRVNAYRLIGYENRLLAAEDFNDDTKDAGEIGAGHVVTALYEIVPAGVEIDLPSVDQLKYQKPAAPKKGSTELMTVKLRYKEPDGQKSKLLQVPLPDREASFEKSSQDLQFAAAVASFGMLLRNSPYSGSADWDKVLKWAKQSLGTNPDEHRQEFIQLVHLATGLQ